MFAVAFNVIETKIVQKIFQKDSSFHVKYRTPG